MWVSESGDRQCLSSWQIAVKMTTDESWSALSHFIERNMRRWHFEHQVSQRWFLRSPRYVELLTKDLNVYLPASHQRVAAASARLNELSVLHDHVHENVRVLLQLVNDQFPTKRGVRWTLSLRRRDLDNKELRVHAERAAVIRSPELEPYLIGCWHALPKDHRGFLGKDVHKVVFERFFQAFAFDVADELLRERLIDDDWRFRADGRPALDAERFVASMLATADAWCETTAVEEFKEFLEHFTLLAMQALSSSNDFESKEVIPEVVDVEKRAVTSVILSSLGRRNVSLDNAQDVEDFTRRRLKDASKRRLAQPRGATALPLRCQSTISCQDGTVREAVLRHLRGEDEARVSDHERESIRLEYAKVTHRDPPLDWQIAIRESSALDAADAQAAGTDTLGILKLLYKEQLRLSGSRHASVSFCVEPGKGGACSKQFVDSKRAQQRRLQQQLQRQASQVGPLSSSLRLSADSLKTLGDVKKIPSTQAAPSTSAASHRNSDAQFATQSLVSFVIALRGDRVPHFQTRQVVDRAAFDRSPLPHEIPRDLLRPPGPSVMQLHDPRKRKGVGSISSAENSRGKALIALKPTSVEELSGRRDGVSARAAARMEKSGKNGFALLRTNHWEKDFRRIQNTKFL
jgi:hypothetical protein